MHIILFILFGGILIAGVLFTFDMDLRKKILISQIIGSIYAILDEFHQYFIPRQKC
ncbi:MAG: VanZ family protein [Clostridia bacterium]|nr:VanZ family protein [Clostridia bacterium]